MPKEPEHQDLFDVLKYTADCGNGFFRLLYQYGVWIPSSEAPKLVDMAWGITEPCVTRVFFGAYFGFYGSNLFTSH